MDQKSFVEMLTRAGSEGTLCRIASEKGFQARPEFRVVQHENPLDDASPEVKSWVLPELCGFVNLKVWPVNGKQNGFTRLFKKYGTKKYDQEHYWDDTSAKVLRGWELAGWSLSKNYYGGHTLSHDGISRTQGMVSKERGYAGAQCIIDAAGFNHVTIESRLD